MRDRNWLPVGWTFTELSNLCIISDRDHRTPVYAAEGVPLISPRDFTRHGINHEGCKTVAYSELEPFERKCKPAKGDVLFSRLGTIGEARLLDFDFPFVALHSIALLKPRHSDVASKYILYLLQSPAVRTMALAGVKSIGTPDLGLQRIKAFDVPVAPPGEQRRIVAKIEELFSDLDAGVAALERVRANLKRYRAAVLKAAVEGRLTEQWRAAHPPAEPADQLLARILTERRKKWEETQLRRFAAAGKTPPKGWREKYEEQRPPKREGLAELPKGWCWTQVESVGHVQLGRQRAPQHHSGPHMRPYLRVANVFENRIDIDDVMQMNFTPAEYETYRLKPEDILLNEGQSMELVGRPAMYRGEVPGACFTNTLVRFSAGPAVLPHFALIVFLGYLKTGRFQKIATITVNIAHLGAGRFAELEFALPPFAEQEAIVAEVERRLSVVDAVEAEIAHSLQRAGRLRQAILKRAFEGKLVPQDPADEPAEKLLQRIRSQGAKPISQSRRVPATARAI